MFPEFQNCNDENSLTMEKFCGKILSYLFLQRFLKYANYSIKDKEDFPSFCILFDGKYSGKIERIKSLLNCSLFQVKRENGWKMMKIKSKYYNEEIIKMMIFCYATMRFFCSIKFFEFFKFLSVLCAFQLFSHPQLKSFSLETFSVLQP